MNTQCKQSEIQFQDLFGRKVIVKNDGERSSSDAGLILLREIETQRKIIKRFSACFTDGRDRRRVTHELEAMLKQRIFAICQGYEDLNDHELLRNDPLLTVVCEKEKGETLAGKSTLNRMELPWMNEKDNRYKKILYNKEAVRKLLVRFFIESFEKEPEEIIIDIDATDDPLHGQQEGRFFHGYYDEYCYLPLYAFVGDHLLLADLMEAWVDPGRGAIGPIRFLLYTIRDHWPDTRIILRGDSGFCREGILTFCESMDNVFYTIGLSKNSRLKRAIGHNMACCKKEFEKTGEKQRIFSDLEYKTRTTWKRKRRVVAKAEYLERGANARFVVTNLDKEKYPCRELYEKTYCARGNMENRIKEQQLFLFADRTSTHYMRSNQLRLWFSSLAYIFFVILRNKGLSSTEMEKAQVHTIRIRLLKVSAMVKQSCRRLVIRLPESFPFWDIWIVINKNLRTA